MSGSGTVHAGHAGCAVAIGVFDGVHLGHRALLQSLTAWARSRGARAVAVTFWPHPEQVLRPERSPCLLQTLPARLASLKQAGVDEVAVLAFDREMAALAPEEFVETVLWPSFRPAALFVGFAFRFGRGASGTAEVLEDMCRRRGSELYVMPPVRLGGEVLSSSLVREKLAAGEVDGAAAALGRPYTLAGPVRAGAGRGRQLGFPTANVEVPAGLCLPLPGVYAALARPAGDGRWLPAVANLGYRPTFGPGAGRGGDGARGTAGLRKQMAAEGAAAPLTLEVHLLDWDGDLAGREVEVGFVARMREERRFDGAAALREQIAADAERALALLGAGAWAAAALVERAGRA